MNGLVKQEIPVREMKPAGIAGFSMSATKRHRKAAAAADAEKRRFKVDLDILECPICSEQFAPPVYQCVNGHTACVSCCNKLTTKGCPSCTHPIGTIRNLAIEKMIESLESDCKYAPFGCKDMLKLSQRERHENELCEHRPIQCPVGGHHQYQCPRSNISTHLITEHGAKVEEFCEFTSSVDFKLKASDEYVMLKSEEKWLLLHCSVEKPSGTAHLYCSVFGGPQNVTKSVPYKLAVQLCKPQQSSAVYSLQAIAPESAWGVHQGNYDYLVVPRARIDMSKRDLNVTVSLIWKYGKVKLHTSRTTMENLEG